MKAILSSYPRGPPPPTPHILLANLPEANEGRPEASISLQGTRSGSVRRARLRVLLLWPAPSSAGRARAGAQLSPVSPLAFISGKVLTLGVFGIMIPRPPAAHGQGQVHQRLLVVGTDSASAGFDCTQATSAASPTVEDRNKTMGVTTTTTQSAPCASHIYACMPPCGSEPGQYHETTLMATCTVANCKEPPGRAAGR